MPRNKAKDIGKENPPEQVRRGYDFDVERLEQLKQLAKARSTPQKPVTIAGLLDEAIRDFLHKEHRNGLPQKTKATAH